MPVRSVTGVIHKPDGTAWSAFDIHFTVTPTAFTASAHYPVETITVTTDAAGAFSVDLETGIQYEVLLYSAVIPLGSTGRRYPPGIQFTIVVPEGVGTVSLEDLRADEATPLTPTLLGRLETVESDTTTLSATVATKADATTVTTALADKADAAEMTALSESVGTPPYQALRPRISRVVSAMQAGHGYALLPGAGTAADDTAIYALGSQSVRIASGTVATVIRKTGIPPIDATGKDVVLWVRVDRPDLLSTITLYVSSNGFSGFATNITDQPGATLPYVVPDEWAAITLPQDTFAVNGTVDWSAITDIQVRVLATSGTVTVHVGGIGLVDQPSGAVVSITIDDGYDDQYTLGRQVLSTYGFPATSYLITDLIDGGSGILSLAQCHELRDLYGWEFAAHAGTIAVHNARYPTQTEADAAADMRACQDWLRRNGFAEGANHFAYPGGNYDAMTLRQVRAHFVSARTTSERPPETYPPADAHRLRTYNVSNTRTPTMVNAAIDDAISANGWLVLVFHHFTAPGGASVSTQYAVDNLETICAHLASTGVSVRTVGDVIRYGV